MNKKVLIFVVNLILSISVFFFISLIENYNFVWNIFFIIFIFRILCSFFIYNDYAISWSRASKRTGLIKLLVGFSAFLLYVPICVFYFKYPFHILIIDVVFYLFLQNTGLFLYQYFPFFSSNKKNVIIYGAGRSGVKIYKELSGIGYKISLFIDDDKRLQKQYVDGIKVISKQSLINLVKDVKQGAKKFDLLILAMPSYNRLDVIRELYDELSNYFNKIMVLPSLADTLQGLNFFNKLREISIGDLLPRAIKDLNRKSIGDFIFDKTILVTGAGGSIGSEICRQCVKYKAKKLLLLDNCEYNLYSIHEELSKYDTIPILQNVTNLETFEKAFKEYKPEIVIHAAAYKHVPMVEWNIKESIYNNVVGTKNCIDLAIKYKAKKMVLISTDKAVRPTNVMGATKRICELYAQNSACDETEICAVRFGNVLGSSGSVIPKFKEQIKAGGPITVTHPEITRFFMLIPEACELVLQAATIGKNGEIFILDMGNPVKIVDLVKKMIALSGKNDIKIEFTGLRPGEKLYEELLINDTDNNTKYKSITIAKATKYDFQKLNKDINKVLKSKPDQIKNRLKDIVPEYKPFNFDK